MTSKVVALSNSIYTLLDTGAGTALYMQARSGNPIRVVLAASLPTPTDDTWFDVDPKLGFSRDGAGGNMYAMASIANEKAVVGEA